LTPGSGATAHKIGAENKERQIFLDHLKMIIKDRKYCNISAKNVRDQTVQKITSQKSKMTLIINLLFSNWIAFGLVKTP
jgi:hypothetical protein